MFGLFKKKVVEPQPPILYDINGENIAQGDEVMSLRYELGKCKVVLEGVEYFYESLDTQKRVSYVRMIDAITQNQKVEKK